MQTSINKIIREEFKTALGVLGLTIAFIGVLNIYGAFGHTPESMPYGEIGQEDQLYFYHHGVLYINVVPTQGNGFFMGEPDINQDYSIDQAIERFGIYEDTTDFNIKPSIYSNVTVLYQLDDDLQFQLTHIYEDSESGDNSELQQLPNRD